MSAAVRARTAGTPTLGPPVPDILLEHLEEMSSLWIQRRALVFSPDAPRRALDRLEARIAAHRDGLAIGGAAATRIAEEQLESDDPWLAACAALVWLEQGDTALAQVIPRLAGLDDAALASWREALRRMEPGAFERRFPPGATTDVPPAAAEALVDARGWRGALDPGAIAAAAQSARAGLRRAAARHARESGVLRALFEDADPGVRNRALWSLARVDPAAALAIARRRATGDAPDPFALRVLGLWGERGDGERIAALVAHPVAGTAAIAALLDLCEPAFAGSLLPLMGAGDEEREPLAREAFESLLGRIPPPDPKAPARAAPPERAHWAEAGPRLQGTRRLRGLPHPWTGAPEDRPLESLWREALVHPAPEDAWLRREVPDGLFEGAPSIEVLPGV